MIGVICFLLAILFVASGFWYYSNSEDTSFHKVMEVMNVSQGRITKLEEKLKEMEVKVNGAVSNAQECRNLVTTYKDDIDLFREQVASTREKQIQLSEKLASKRPMIKMPTGPIAIEIIPGTAAPKGPKKETITKLKKQLEGLSK